MLSPAMIPISAYYFVVSISEIICFICYPETANEIDNNHTTYITKHSFNTNQNHPPL